MSVLSPGASLVCQIAAMEAEGAGHEQIQPGHLLVGLLSLEKFRDATVDELGLPPDTVNALHAEIDRVAAVLAQVNVVPGELRARIRDELGLGRAAAGRRSVAQSDASRAAFVRADLMARGEPTSALHLLAAVADDPDGPVDLALRRCGLDSQILAAAAGA